MAYEKSWQFSLNNAYVPSSQTDQLKYMMWWIKAFLSGGVAPVTSSIGLWTVVSSSNALTASAGDNWGAAYTASNFISFSGSTTGSWLQLRSPQIAITGSTSSSFDLLIVYSSSLAPVSGFTVAFSKTPMSGGLTTAFPSSSDMWVVRNLGGWGANQGWESIPWSDPAVAAGIKLHGGLATDGTFYIFKSRDASGKAQAGLVFSTVAERNTTIDQYPVWTLAGADNTNGALGGGAGGPVAPSIVTAGGPGVRHYNGLYGTVGVANVGSLLDFSAFGTAIGGSGLNVSPFTDVQDGTAWNFPAYVAPNYYIGTNNMYVRGRLQDMGIGNKNLGYSTQSPATGSVQYMLIGCLWLPADAAPQF